MSQNHFTALFLVLWFTLGNFAFANERKEARFIKNAFDDQLYLQVAQKSKLFFENSSYDQKGKTAQRIRIMAMWAALERGAPEKALDLHQQFIQLSPQSHLKPLSDLCLARALYEAYVEKGYSLPKAYQKNRPSQIIESQIKNLMTHKRMTSGEGGDLPNDLVTLAYPTGLYIQGLDEFSIGQTQNYQNAKSLFQKIHLAHREFPHHTDATYHLGQSYYFLDDYKKAGRYFSELVNENKKSKQLPEYEFWQGLCLFELGQRLEAEELFLKALSHSPEEKTLCDIHYNLAWLYSGQGRHSEAIRHFKALLQPEFKMVAARYLDSTRYKLASLILLHDENAYSESLKQLNAIGPKSPLRPKVDLLSAHMLYRLAEQARKEDAAKIYQRAIQYVDPLVQDEEALVRAEAQKIRALIHFELKEYDACLKILNGLVHFPVPLDYKLDIMLQLAEVHFKKKNFYEAEHLYLQLLKEKDPALSPGIHFKLATCVKNTNPLIEVIMKRQRMRFADRFSSVDDEALNGYIRRSDVVLSIYWDIASTAPSQRETHAPPFSEESFIRTFGAYLKAPIDEWEKEIRTAETKKEENHEKKLPEFKFEKTIKDQIYRKLVSTFNEQLAENTLPGFKDSISQLGVYGEVHPVLQEIEVRKYLNLVIQSNSPYIALAHYEQAKIYSKKAQDEERKRNSSTFYSHYRKSFIAHLEKAVKNANNIEQSNQFRLELALAYFKLAEKINRETSYNIEFNNSTEDDVETKLKDVDSYLRITLNQLQALSSDFSKQRDDDISHLKFQSHKLLSEDDEAVETLVQFIKRHDDPVLIDQYENLLIDFFKEQNRPLSAAQRLQAYAMRIASQQPIKAESLQYQAAELYSQHSDPDRYQEAITIFETLAKSPNPSIWSMRAQMQLVEILHRQNKNEEANAIITEIAIPEETPKALEIEYEVLLAKHLLKLGRKEEALKKHAALLQSLQKEPKVIQVTYLPNALWNHALWSEKDSPSQAADLYQQFYYEYTKDSRREAALVRCCEIRIELLQKSKGEQLEKEHRLEIKNLISKLRLENQRKKLFAQLASIP